MNSAYDFNKGDKVVILRGEYKGIHGVIRDLQDDTYGEPSSGYRSLGRTWKGS